MCLIFKILSFVLVVALAVPTSSSIDSREPASIVQGENLYGVALVASVTEMEKSWGKIDDGDGGSRIRTDYHHVLVEKDPEITDALAAPKGESQFEYLDYAAQVQRYKQHRKPYAILKIHPIQSNGKKLTIHVAKNWIEFKKGRLFVSISDWSDVEFQVDSGKDGFVVTNVKLGGI